MIVTEISFAVIVTEISGALIASAICAAVSVTRPQLTEELRFMVTHVVILVDNSSQAIMAKKILKTEGIDAKLIPTPRKLSSNCGTAVRILEKGSNEAKKTLEENEAAYSQLAPLIIY